jgi:hypothetical protein
MREYHSPEPIILSVGEDEEVSIADVAKHVAGNHRNFGQCRSGTGHRYFSIHAD